MREPAGNLNRGRPVVRLRFESSTSRMQVWRYLRTKLFHPAAVNMKGNRSVQYNNQLHDGELTPFRKDSNRHTRFSNKLTTRKYSRYLCLDFPLFRPWRPSIGRISTHGHIHGAYMTYYILTCISIARQRPQHTRPIILEQCFLCARPACACSMMSHNNTGAVFYLCPRS
jgi:hypothetical protein